MLSARLQLRQRQSLVLTPQLLQSIRLLQHSHAELGAFVDAEIERNPLLERAPAEAEPDAAERSAETSSNAGTSASVGGTASGGADGIMGRTRSSSATGGDGRSFEAAGPNRPSLADHALAEIAEACRDPVIRRIGALLAPHLDDAGWLDCDPAAVVGALKLPPDVVEAALCRIQDVVEPAGLFARNLSDCLAIQLRRRDRLDPVMRCVLDRLDLLARRDFAALMRLTGEDEAGLFDILAEIRGLDPKPGQRFFSGESEAIVPDVMVSSAPDGSWRIELNPDTLPRLVVNETYAATLAPATARDEAGKAFVAECLGSANWLIRSLDQRARTLLKVATEIVRRQDDFLANGVSGLKPMTLAAVAEAIGMHESTVSRVTTNKHMQTPRGSFEMKFFFTVAIAATHGGEAHSAESVKHRIRMLVDRETAARVLSDDDIAEALRTEGVDLARRTVAKYREALAIPSSIQRRRELNARRLAS